MTALQSEHENDSAGRTRASFLSPTAHRRVRTCAAAMILAATSCGPLRMGMGDAARSQIDPETGREYLLYKPAGYDREQQWPLLVVLAGAFPDSPKARIEAFCAMADARGFLVAAPSTQSSTGPIPAWGKRSAQNLLEDERQILSVVQHVRAGYNISDDRVLLSGSGPSAMAVLSIGISHPAIFRAISLTQPRFDETALSAAAKILDPHQPVRVHYKGSDQLLGRRGKECVAWLRERHAGVVEDPYGAGRGDDAVAAMRFFEDVIRRTAWIRIASTQPDAQRPRQFQFRVDSSIAPKEYRWEFGDGAEMPTASPVHEYSAPGRYRATCHLTDAKGKRHQRSVDILAP